MTALGGESHFAGYVTADGKWHIEGTAGVKVVPAGVKWAARITESHTGEWEVTPLPIEHDPVPPPTFLHIYDATNPKSLTRFAADSHNILVAYNDGLFNDLTEARALFPNNHIFDVCVKYGDKANFADTEPGNMTQSQAIASWLRELVNGIYADISDWEIMLPVITEHEKTLNRKCVKWIADPNPNNVPHIPAWADICQYGFDGTFDISLARYESIAHLL